MVTTKWRASWDYPNWYGRFDFANSIFTRIFNEFAWLVHEGILDGVKKNQIQGVC